MSSVPLFLLLLLIALHLLLYLGTLRGLDDYAFVSVFKELIVFLLLLLWLLLSLLLMLEVEVSLQRGLLILAAVH